MRHPQWVFFTCRILSQKIAQYSEEISGQVLIDFRSRGNHGRHTTCIESLDDQ